MKYAQESNAPAIERWHARKVQDALYVDEALAGGREPMMDQASAMVPYQMGGKAVDVRWRAG